MARHKDINWSVPEPYVENGRRVTGWDTIKVSLLMDIRDELKALNAKLACHRIPRALDDLHLLGVAARRKRRKP